MREKVGEEVASAWTEDINGHSTGGWARRVEKGREQGRRKCRMAGKANP